MTTSPLDPVVIIERVRAKKGRLYKRLIRHAWETGDYSELSDYQADLQRIRNTYGPSWLYYYQPRHAVSAVIAVVVLLCLS